jgi:hypothetical protein
VTAPQEAAPAESYVPQEYKWTQQTHDALLAGMPGGGIDRLTQLATGNDHLVTNPGLLSALAQGNATREQAGAINQFMAGLDAEKQVSLARASSQKLVLSSDQQAALDTMGVHYDDVNQTAQAQLDAYTTQLSKEGRQVAKDQNGQVILKADGTPVLTQMDKPKQGWGFGRVFSDAASGLVKPWHFMAAAVTKEIPSVIDEALGSNSKTDTAAQQDAQMRAAGYDPGSFFSGMEYMASGRDHFMNLATKLAPEWDATQKATGISGQDAVLQAIEFTSNPAAYQKKIENDPTLTMPEKADKMAFLNSDAFVQLTKRVGAKSATVGNLAVDGVIDPIKHPLAYGVTSAGVDFAASLALDPTILAGKAFNGVKLAALGIKPTGGVIDGTKVQAMFQPMSAWDKLKNPFVAGLQRRWTNYLDQTQEIARVDKLGNAASKEDVVSQAQAYQKIQSQFPELISITPDMTGASRVLDINNLAKAKEEALIIGSGEAFKTLPEVGDYLSSKINLLRTFQGKAALEGSLMPGATSLFGLRVLRANLPVIGATTRAGKSAAVNLNRLDQAIKILPNAAEAVAADGTVLAGSDLTAAAAHALLDNAEAANKAGRGVKAGDVGLNGILDAHINQARTAIDEGQNPAEVLASARRGAMNDPAVKGQIQNNMLRYGSADGQTFSLGGVIAARAELAARRFGSLLPRNTDFKLDDPATVEKFYRYGLQYMNKGDAALLAAKWATADEGVRRSLISALQIQTMHAAGFGFTESGRAALSKVESLNDFTNGALDATKVETQAFSASKLDEAQDPLMGGQTVHYALHVGQTRDEWHLPSFASLQRDAVRFGVWDRIMGRAFTSNAADIAMHGFKMIQLMKPSTYTRNMLEGWLNAAFRGEAVGGIRARALTSAVEHEKMSLIKTQAKAEGWSRAQTNAAMDEAHIIPNGWTMTQMQHLAPSLIMGQWYRSALGRMAGDTTDSQFVLKLLENPAEARAIMHAYGTQHLASDVAIGDPAGQQANFDAGLGSKPLTFTGGSKIEGWAVQATDGFEGAQRLERALGVRLQTDPAYGKLLLDAAGKNDGDVSQLLWHIANNPNFAKRVQSMRFAKLFQDADGHWVQATDEADQATALHQLLQRQVADVRHLLTGKNGEYSTAVADRFAETGRVPDADWIQKNLVGDARPEHVDAPKYAAAVPLKPLTSGWFNAIFEKVDKAYVRLVEDPIQRTTSMPLFLSHYGTARTAMMGMEKDLVDTHGLNPDVADSLMKEYAMKQAWVKTESMIDDPGLKAQFDVVGRNFFAYSRATQAMIRRWSQAMVQDPTRMTKAALAVQAGEHSGAIWKDQNGELNFTYPGSGVFINLMNDMAQHVPILGGFLQIPTMPDLTGKVMLSVPGLENPFHLSATPLVNVPFRLVERLVLGHVDPTLPTGDHLSTLMAEIDRQVNGPIGVGQIVSQFEPVGLKKFVDAFSSDQRNGMLASATTSALANMKAAGIVPGPNATPDEWHRFIANVRIQVRNQLFLRAVLGLWMPAAPSSPTNETSGSGADPSFSARGIHSLDSEFKTMMNDMGGDHAAAMQLWAQIHPDKMIYTESKSTSLANKAYLAATDESLRWAQNNAGFINKYKSVAGYFLPENPGAFSSTAYALQRDMGLRQMKTPEEFLQTAAVNDAWSQYTPMTQKFDANIKGAQDAGDDAAVASLKKARAQAITDFNLANPLFAARNAGYAVKGNDAKSNLAELRQLINDPSVPKDVPVQQISDMVQSWDAYEQWKTNNPATTNSQRDMRTVMASQFQQYMAAKAQEAPGLIDLYRGVFRQLDTKLIDLNANN